MKHFDFLVSVSKSKPEESIKLLKEATTEQIDALVVCLSLRQKVTCPPVSKRELLFFKILKRKKRVKRFLEKNIKLFLPMIIIVLSKALENTVECACDLA